MKRPLITECEGDRRLVVTLGEDAARQIVPALTPHLRDGGSDPSPWAVAVLVRALTGAEIHLSDDDAEALADSTADAWDVATDPQRDAQDAADRLIDARKGK